MEGESEMESERRDSKMGCYFLLLALFPVNAILEVNRKYAPVEVVEAITRVHLVPQRIIIIICATILL